MVLVNILVYGFLYTLIGTGYIFILMVTFNPRIWGYQDYPKRIKEKVASQTRRERAIAGLVSLPFFIFILGYPIITTALLETNLGGEINFEVAFFNIFFMMISFFLADLVILDWLIISKITPKFVIIDGTTPEDYKDFTHHYQGHLIALIPLTIICVILSLYFICV
jgi:hypothetical protein